MDSRSDLFLDRRDAGRRLATALAGFRTANPVIVAIPRGGVPVAFEVAQALGAPLDLLFSRKISAPGSPEFGLGAIVDEGASPLLLLDPEAMSAIRPSRSHIEREKARRLDEIARLKSLYLEGRESLSVEGRTVILIDDGLATGNTVRAGLEALRRNGACRIVLGLPVAAAEALSPLAGVADDIVCLQTPSPFHAVSIHYRQFDQTTDEEVVALMREARSMRGRPPLSPDRSHSS